MSNITCPDCDGEGGTVHLDELGNDDFYPCESCNGEGTLDDEDLVEPIYYKEQDEFDASKEQDIKDSLREEGL